MDIKSSLCLFTLFILCERGRALTNSTASLLTPGHDICFNVDTIALLQTHNIPPTGAEKIICFYVVINHLEDLYEIVNSRQGIHSFKIIEEFNVGVIFMDKYTFNNICSTLKSKDLEDFLVAYNKHVDHVTGGNPLDHVTDQLPEQCRDVNLEPRNFTERYTAIKQLLKYLISVYTKKGAGRVWALLNVLVRRGRLDILPCDMTHNLSRDTTSYIANYNIDVWCCVLAIVAILLSTTLYLTVITILHILEKSGARNRAYLTIE